MITENTLRVKIEATGDGQLKASLENAAQSVAALDTSQQSNAAATDTATVAQDANAAALAAVGIAAQDTAAKVAAGALINGETAAQQMARIRAMVAASREQDAANRGVVLSERALAEMAGKRVELSQAEWAAIQANAEATRAKVAADIEAMAAEDGLSAATAVNTRQTEANTAAHAMNSRTQYELGILGSELASGNIGRMKRSAAALANATGLTASIMTPVGLALTGAAAAVGIFAAAAFKGEEQVSALNRAILSTGNYAGVTIGQLDGMAQSIAGGTVTIGQAREAVAAFTESGRFSREQIGKLAQAAVDAGDLMGKSIGQVVSDFTRLQESPVAASEKLNESTHYLTTSILQQIVALKNQGNTIGAADLAMKTYADSLRDRVAEANTHLGTLERSWNSVKSSASFAWDAMLGVGRDKTAEEQQAGIEDRLLAAARMGMAHYDARSGHVGWAVTAGNTTENTAYVNSLIEQMKALGLAKSKIEEKASATGVAQEVAARPAGRSAPRPAARQTRQSSAGRRRRPPAY